MARYQRTGVASLAAAVMAVTGLASPALAAGAPAGPAVAGDISTVAGGVGGPGPATGVAIPVPCGVAFGDGHLHVASNGEDIGQSGTVSQVTPATGRLSTPVGDAAVGYAPLGDGGPATAADLHSCGVTTDHSGNLVIVDQGNKRVRVVPKSSGTFYGQAMTAGDIYTVAGNGSTRGYGGTGVPATSTGLKNPVDVAVDPHGNLVITDSGSAGARRGLGTGARIQVVAATSGRFYGKAMTAGDIYTVAGFKTGVALSGLGGPGHLAALGIEVGDVRVDSMGNVLFCVEDASRVLVLAERTGTYYGQAMTFGHLYSIAGDGIGGDSGDGGPATAAELGQPAGVTVDHTGNVVIADTVNNRVRVVAESSGTFYGQAMTAGDIYTVAGNGTVGFSGDGGPATSAQFDGPASVAVDASGNLLVADTANSRVRVVAESPGTFYGQAMTAGDIYTVAGNGTLRYSGDGDLAARAQLYEPSSVAVDGAGDVAISDGGNYRVRVVAGATGTRFGRPMTAGHIYTVAGNGNETPLENCAGRAATARPLIPEGVALDASGNLLVSDGGSRLCVVAATSGTFYGQAMTAGHIYQIAGKGGGAGGYSGDGGPATQAKIDAAGVTVDQAGNVVMSDATARIRVVAESSGTFYGQAMTAGDIYTVAGDGTVGFTGDGGPATSAELRDPFGIAVDGAGNLVFADAGNSRVRVVAVATGRFYGQAMTAGDIYTVAGDGSGEGYTGDGGPATSASLEFPEGVAVDGAGNLVIGDSGNNAVRLVAKSSGTFYGQAMTKNDIYTVAGTGSCGFTGDGGPGTSAYVCFPEGVAADQAGGLLIADFSSNRVRQVSG